MNGRVGYSGGSQHMRGFFDQIDRMGADLDDLTKAVSKLEKQVEKLETRLDQQADKHKKQLDKIQDRIKR